MRISYSSKEHCFIQHALDTTLSKQVLLRPKHIALIDAAIAHHKIPMLLAPPGFGKSTLIKQWLQTQTAQVVWLRPRPTGSSLDYKQPLSHWLDCANLGLNDLRALAQPLPLQHALHHASPTQNPRHQRNSTPSSAIADPIIVVLDNADQLPIEVWLLVQNIHRQWPEACQFVVCAEQHLLPRQHGTLPLGLISADELRFDESEINLMLSSLPNTKAGTSTLNNHAISNPFSSPNSSNNTSFSNNSANSSSNSNSTNSSTHTKKASHSASANSSPSKTAATQELNGSINRLNIDPEWINAIHGWPVLLSGLIATYHWHHNNAHIDTVGNHFNNLCYDLIEHEVLASLSPMDYTVVEFIEHLPYFTQALANTLWPQHSISNTLQTLTQRLLITTNSRTGQIELSEPWLNQHFHGRVPRYDVSPDDLFEIAAEWYESHELIGAALSCYVHLRQWKKVADLAENHAERLTKGNDWQRVTRWLERLPQEILGRHPKLMSLLAWQSISLLRKSMATDYISRASAIQKPASLRQQPHYDNLSLIHKLQHIDVEAEIENLEDVSESLSILLERKSHDQRFFLVNTMAKKSAHSANLRLHLQVLQHFCCWEFPQSIKAANRLIKQSMAERNATLTLNALYLLSWSLYATGEHRSLFKHAHNISQWLADNHFQAHPLAVWTEACQANILRESGQLEESEQLIQLLERHFNQPDAPILHKYTTWMLRALQHRSLGNLHGAQDYVERADAIVHQLPLQFTQTVMSAPALRADILMLQERLDDAEVLLEPLTPPFWRDNPEQHDTWAIALYYLLKGLRNGDPDTLEAPLKVLIQFGARRKHRAFELYVRSLLCVGFFRLNEHKKARHTLLALLKQIEGSGFKRVLLDRGKHMGNLLLKTGEKHATNPLLIPWLEQLPYEQYGDSLHYDFIKLSKREIEILSLIAQGKSNEEISQALCRSLGTVKLHVHNIYKKLGVSSRIQAIQKCEACGFDSELMS